jgi:Lrp/AsnC family leucine-responsive transcriptional regulator
LDETNRRILSALEEDARCSLAELGRRVGMSAPAVGERLARLEATGVITAYRVEVDPAALGYPLAAVIRVRPDGRQLPRISDIARDSPEVVWCHRITGEDCLILKAHLRSVAHLEEVIDRFTPFGQTTTSIVQSSPVPGRGVPVSAPME